MMTTALGTLAGMVAGSRTCRHLLSKLANAPWFQPVSEMLLHRVMLGLHTLKQCGLAPAVVIDVGAYIGDWTRGAMPYFPQARFVMVEAQPDKESVLRPLCGGRVSLHMCLLGATEKPGVEFFLSETGSSTYIETTAFKPAGKVTLPMKTLDCLMGNETGPIFLKLDVQGAEIDVLEGAGDLLNRIDAVLLEASIVEYNVGAPRIAEIVRYLAERGFLVFDIADHRRIGPVLAQVDLIFVKANSPIAARAQSHINNYGR